jgi:outer membrane protein insertion porin family
VVVGGQFRLLGSVEYMMPLTADDMIKAVAFVDYGTVEREITIAADNFRVAPGFGFRISVPALGPAPLAFDFAFPVAKASTDNTQVFSFFFGIGRS